jgi:hypothetical protein
MLERPDEARVNPPASSADFVLVPVPVGRVLDVYRLLASESGHPAPAPPAPSPDLVDAFLSDASPADLRLLRLLVEAGERGVLQGAAMQAAGFDEPRAFGGWFGAFRRRAALALGVPLPLAIRERRAQGRRYALSEASARAMADGLDRQSNKEDVDV